jgi:hypothetical protein
MVKDNETYEQNTRGMMGKSKYKVQIKPRKPNKVMNYVSTLQKLQPPPLLRKNSRMNSPPIFETAPMTKQRRSKSWPAKSSASPKPSCSSSNYLQQIEQAQQQAHWRWPPTKAVHQATKHGLLLLAAWIPPGRRESHEHNMHVEKRGP